MPGRTIAVGDIHGCSVALDSLLQAVRPREDDTLVFLGDYIDRGPDSRGVLDRLIALRERCVLVPLLGNHEEMVLAARADASALRFWLSCGGMAAIRSYGPGADLFAIPPEHWAFLESCRDYFETDTHIFTHAGCEPHLPMNRQTAEQLRWAMTTQWSARRHCSGKVVVVGHTAQRDGHVLDLGWLICIDTFCHGGGWLTAYDVETHGTWQANQQGQVVAWPGD